MPPSTSDLVNSALANAAFSGEVWDVVVIGGGPAGSSTAEAAAAAGALTLLVDAAEFPRYKTCGGGLIGVSARLIPDLDAVPVRDIITTLSITNRGKGLRKRSAPRGFMKMITRADLDQHLLRYAEKAGATVRFGVKVSDVDTAESGLVLLRTNSGDILARCVVGADGAVSRVARAVGVEYGITDLGLEAEIEAGSQVHRWAGRVHLDFGPIKGSYGWVFPKGDVLTVGVIAEKGNPEATRDYLEKFIAMLGLEGNPRVRESGHLTRCRSTTSPFSHGRLLVAGDAAGLLEPWTREGISFAMRSGAFAGGRAAQLASASSDVDLETARRGYDQDLSAELLPEMKAGLTSRDAFSVNPWSIYFLIAHTSTGWKYFQRLSSGDTNLARALRHGLARWPLTAMARRVDSAPLIAGGDYLPGSVT